MGGDAEMIERGRWQSEEKHSKMDRRPKADGMSEGQQQATKARGRCISRCHVPRSDSAGLGLAELSQKSAGPHVCVLRLGGAMRRPRMLCARSAGNTAARAPSPDLFRNAKRYVSSASSAPSRADWRRPRWPRCPCPRPRCVVRGARCGPCSPYTPCVCVPVP